MSKELMTRQSANNALANVSKNVNVMGTFDLTNKVMQDNAIAYRDAVIQGIAGTWKKADAIRNLCDKSNYAKDNDFESQKDVCTFLGISTATATQSIKALYLVDRIPTLQGLSVKTVYNMNRYLVDKTGNTDKVTQFLIMCGQTLDNEVSTFEDALPLAVEYLKAYTDVLAEVLIKCYSEHNTLFLEDSKDTEDSKDIEKEVKPSIGDFIQSVVGWNNTHTDDVITAIDIVTCMVGLGLCKPNNKNVVSFPIVRK